MKIKLPLLLSCAASLLLLSGCLGGSSENHSNYWAYLPVQFEKDGPISFIDTDGNVVVSDEYGSDNGVTGIFAGEDKVFWVKSGSKVQLYSLDSPKKPLTSKEYDHVTAFRTDRACVSRSGNPIEVINSKGKVVATLPKSIVEARAFANCGIAKVVNAEGQEGWIDRSGKVVADKFYSVATLDNGIVIAQKEAEGKLLLYSTAGKQLGSLSNDYTIQSTCVDDELFIVAKTNEEGKAVNFQAMNAKGETKFRIRRCDWVKGTFADGYVIFYYEGHYGVLNYKGEEVIRAKYDALDYVGNGLFSARKSSDGKYGVINAKDERVLGFEYDEIIGFGKNFIVKEGDFFNVVDRNGKELTKDSFRGGPGSSCDSHVTYFDVDGFADAIVAEVAKCKLSASAKAIASEIGLTESDAENNRYTTGLSTNIQIYGLSLSALYRFSDYVATEITHEEVEGGEYYSWTRTVIDGYRWNDAAGMELADFSFYSSSTGVESSVIAKAIKAKLRAAGYAESGDVLTAHGRSVSVSEYDNQVRIQVSKN